MPGNHNNSEMEAVFGQPVTSSNLAAGGMLSNVPVDDVPTETAPQTTPPSAASQSPTPAGTKTASEDSEADFENTEKSLEQNASDLMSDGDGQFQDVVSAYMAKIQSGISPKDLVEQTRVFLDQMDRAQDDATDDQTRSRIGSLTDTISTAIEAYAKRNNIDQPTNPSTAPATTPQTAALVPGARPSPQP